uniref:Asparagine synthetase [glutamine-hydrolyzing] n=1 Tax=Caenorhabditis japonica TaxID=281687 RepID=A0A8R1E0R5_CAEJA
MCGVFAICQQAAQCKQKFDLDEARRLSRRQYHRGPDFSGSYQDPKTGDILVHERLAIMDLGITHPLQGTAADRQVIHNGEIYNHQALRDTELKNYKLRTTCDSEVIIFLYEKYRDGFFCNLLDGVFAFALCCEGEFLAARDPVGVKQMYYGVDSEGRYFFSNEMKCLEDSCGDVKIESFPPGHYYTPKTGFVRYFQPEWFDYKKAIRPLDLKLIQSTMITAVHKRLMSDAPLGVLLSGGLDSSLVSSIASREMKKRGLTVHSFSIGVDHNSPDVVAARKVADFIGTTHHEFYFSIEAGIQNLRKLIWHLESYDVTSIRASTPMYFLSEEIRKLGIKVVLSGEGADEIFGGYLYFHNAPSDEDFQKETIDRVLHLYTSDCLRADKSSMAHSVEVRVPFLDKSFLDASISLDPAFKRPQKLENGRSCEKYVLRSAFNTDQRPYLPHEILWRQKEQFSDGVGYSWIDSLMQHCADEVTDKEFAQAAKVYPHNTPHSKEAFYMRKIFHELFPSEQAAKTVRKWIPKWQKNQDPSGRASLVHEQSVHNLGEDFCNNKSAIIEQCRPQA